MNEKLIGFGVGLEEQTAAIVERSCRQAGLEWVRQSMAETFIMRDDLGAPSVIIAALPEESEAARQWLDRLSRRQSPASVIFLAHQFNHRAIVEALRAGAEEVLQWPAEIDRLDATVARCLEASLRKHRQVIECRQAQDKLAQLSIGEREVLELMLAGKVNKLVASRLGIALRTVENRRKQIFSKLGTRGFAEIVRMVQNADRLLRVDLPQPGESSPTMKLERAS